MADSGAESAVGLAVQGMRQLLQADKKEGSTASATKHCQSLQCIVQQLLNAVEQLRSKVRDGGTEVADELARQLCSCFSTAAAVLTLCKEIQTGSSWLFDELSSLLSALFKATFTLIKTSTDALDLLNLDSLDHNTLTTVVSSLQSLCAPVLHFDPSLPVLVWKGLGRVLCRGRESMPDDWTIQPIMVDICVTIETKTVECVQCAPGEGEGSAGVVFVKLIKLCRFLSSLLVKLVQEFHSSTAEYGSDLANLLMQLYCAVPPLHQLSAPLPTLQGCEQLYTVGAGEQPIASGKLSFLYPLLSLSLLSSLPECEPVITALLDCAEFLKCFLSPSLRKGQVFGWLMCLCIILKNYPKLNEGLQDLVMESISSRESFSGTSQLLDALFKSLSQCNTELQLPVRVPGVMCNGQPQRSVMLYEHVLTHFCSFLACLPHRHFPRMEAVLMRHVVNRDVHCALLASDGLTFLARWGGEELASSYAHLLAQLVQLSPVVCCPTRHVLCVLLRRVVTLLPHQHQAHFITSHPPTSPPLLSLWSQVDLTKIHESLQTQLSQQLAATSGEAIKTQLLLESPHFPSLHWALRCLHLSHPHLHPSHQHTSLTTALQAWDWISQRYDSNKLQQWPVAVLCDCVELIADFLSLLPPQPLLKVFNFLRDIITRGSPTAVCLSITHFLAQCSHLKVPSNIQTPVLRSLVSLFQLLLSHSSWLVVHHSLLAFRQFAESTPYASVVEQCIPPSLSDLVVDFLKSVPFLSSSRPELAQREFWLQELGKRGERVERWREGEEMTEALEDNGDSSKQDMVSCKVQLLLRTWEELQHMKLPSSASSQLQTLCSSIQHHLSSHPSLSQSLSAMQNS